MARDPNQIRFLGAEVSGLSGLCEHAEAEDAFKFPQVLPLRTVETFDIRINKNMS